MAGSLHLALAALIQEGGAAAPGTADTPAAGGSYGLFLIETLLILLLVCGLAYAVVRFGLRRLYDVGPQARGPLRVVARLPLEPRRTVYIIEAAGKTLLVGVGEGGPMTVLAELDEAAVAQALAAAPRQKSFLEVLNLKRRGAGDRNA